MSRRLKATPSRTARTKWARVCEAVMPTKAARALGIEVRGALAEEVRRPEQAVAAGGDLWRPRR